MEDGSAAPGVLVCRISKESKLAVVHFYRDSTERCKIIDMHLSRMAPKHIMTRMVKVPHLRTTLRTAL